MVLLFAYSAINIKTPFTMKAPQIMLQVTPPVSAAKAPKTRRISFAAFQKLILANTQMRKQVRDIVDLALFDYAIRQNMELIRAAQMQAEKEAIELMMLFSVGLSDVKLFSRLVHQNRVVKTLARLDVKDHEELVKRCI